MEQVYLPNSMATFSPTRTERGQGAQRGRRSRSLYKDERIRCISSVAFWTMRQVYAICLLIWPYHRRWQRPGTGETFRIPASAREALPLTSHHPSCSVLAMLAAVLTLGPLHAPKELVFSTCKCSTRAADFPVHVFTPVNRLCKFFHQMSRANSAAAVRLRQRSNGHRISAISCTFVRAVAVSISGESKKNINWLLVVREAATLLCAGAESAEAFERRFRVLRTLTATPLFATGAPCARAVEGGEGGRTFHS